MQQMDEKVSFTITLELLPPSTSNTMTDYSSAPLVISAYTPLMSNNTTGILGISRMAFTYNSYAAFFSQLARMLAWSMQTPIIPRQHLQG